MKLDTRPRRRTVLLAGAGGIAGLAAVCGGIYGVVRPGNAGLSIGGPFELTDSSAHAVTERSWPGKYLLVYFGYTYCPDVCPTTLNAIAAALDKLGRQADRIQPLFITVDPRRDTPKVLADYTAAFTARLVGLTGSAEQIAQVAREYRVYFAEHKTGPGPDDYTMDHSSVVYLMAPDGQLAAVLSAQEQPAAMAAELLRHLPPAPPSR
jgi:protein SCO1/2